MELLGLDPFFGPDLNGFISNPRISARRRCIPFPLRIPARAPFLSSLRSPHFPHPAILIAHEQGPLIIGTPARDESEGKVFSSSGIQSELREKTLDYIIVHVFGPS